MTARVLQSIFSYENAEQVKVLISFIEIYNEQAYDLLAENQQEPFYNKGKYTFRFVWRRNTNSTRMVSNFKAILLGEINIDGNNDHNSFACA